MAKPIKKPLKAKKLTAEEQHWKQVEEKSKELINNLFDTNLPFDFAYEALNLEKSTDWRVLARDDVPQAYQEEELPDQDYLAEEITYHYLLTIIKRFMDDLSNYDCHNPAYFENLIEN